MFCSNCGNQLEEGVRFCSQCGEEMGKSTSGIPAPISQPKKSRIGCGLGVIGVSLFTIIVLYLLITLKTIPLPSVRNISFLPDSLINFLDSTQSGQFQKEVDLWLVANQTDIDLGDVAQAINSGGSTVQIKTTDIEEFEIEADSGECHWTDLGDEEDIQNLVVLRNGSFIFDIVYPDDFRLEYLTTKEGCAAGRCGWGDQISCIGLYGDEPVFDFACWILRLEEVHHPEGYPEVDIQCQLKQECPVTLACNGTAPPDTDFRETANWIEPLKWSKVCSIRAAQTGYLCDDVDQAVITATDFDVDPPDIPVRCDWQDIANISTPETIGNLKVWDENYVEFDITYPEDFYLQIASKGGTPINNQLGTDESYCVGRSDERPGYNFSCNALFLDQVIRAEGNPDVQYACTLKEADPVRLRCITNGSKENVLDEGVKWVQSMNYWCIYGLPGRDAIQDTAVAAGDQPTGDDICALMASGEITDIQRTEDSGQYGFAYKFPEGIKIEDARESGKISGLNTKYTQFTTVICIYSFDEACIPLFYFGLRGDNVMQSINCKVTQEDPGEIFCETKFEMPSKIMDLQIDIGDSQTAAKVCDMYSPVDFENTQVVDALNEPDGDCPDQLAVDSQAYLVQNLLVIDVTLPEGLQTNPPQYAYINTSGVSCNTMFESNIDCQIDPNRPDHLLCRTTEFEINSFDGMCSKHLMLYQDNSKDCVLAVSGVTDMFSANQPTAAAGGEGQCPAGEEYHAGSGCCTVGCWCDGGCYNDCPGCPP